MPKEQIQLNGYGEILQNKTYRNSRESFFIRVNDPSTTPQDEDFIEVDFRLLSAGIVAGGSWRATDFSNELVLKAALSVFEGKPVYTDHSVYSIENAIGTITNVRWQDGYEMDGIRIPGGVNATLRIDAVANPRIVRQLLSNMITSTSVTVLYEWEMSHEIQNGEDFSDIVGEIRDGRMVTRKVTNILDIYETSLVWLGADPTAKKLDDNDMVMFPDVSAMVPEDMYAKREYKTNKKLIAANAPQLLAAAKTNHEIMADNKQIVPQASATKPEQAEQQTKIEDKANAPENSQLEKLQAEKTEAEKKAEKFVNLCAELEADKSELLAKANDAAKQIEELTINSENLEKQVEEFRQKAEQLEKSAKVGENYLKMKREQAVELYRKSVAKPQESVVRLIGKATDEEVDGLIMQYGEELVGKFSAHCKECGSAKVSFRSSLEPATKSKNEGKEDGFTVDSYRH